MLSKNISILVASWLIEYCQAGNFGFPVLILKHLNLTISFQAQNSPFLQIFSTLHLFHKKDPVLNCL